MIRRLGSFALPPFLALLAPMLVLPVIAGRTTISGWAALSTGQSIGALGALVIAIGWPLVGPPRAAASPGNASRLYFDSLRTKAVAALFAAPPLTLIVVLAAPGGELPLTALTTAAYALIGLSPSWLAIGLDKPFAVLLCEVAPKFILSASAAVVVVSGGSIYVYPALLIASCALSPILFALFIVRPKRHDAPPLGSSLRRLFVPATTVAAAGAYSAGAILIVGLSSTDQVTGVTASADRLYRIALFAVASTGAALQPWVMASSGRIAHRRRQIALRMHVLLGLAGGSAYAFLGSNAASYLFGDRFAPGPATTFWYGVAFFAVSVGTSLGHHRLMPQGGAQAVLRGTLLGAAAGIPAIVYFSSRFGSPGAAFAIALGELVVVAAFAGQWRLRRDEQHFNFDTQVPTGADEQGAPPNEITNRSIRNRRSSS